MSLSGASSASSTVEETKGLANIERNAEKRNRLREAIKKSKNVNEKLTPEELRDAKQYQQNIENGRSYYKKKSEAYKKMKENKPLNDEELKYAKMLENELQRRREMDKKRRTSYNRMKMGDKTLTAEEMQLADQMKRELDRKTNYNRRVLNAYKKEIEGKEPLNDDEKRLFNMYKQNLQSKNENNRKKAASSSSSTADVGARETASVDDDLRSLLDDFDDEYDNILYEHGAASEDEAENDFGEFPEEMWSKPQPFEKPDDGSAAAPSKGGSKAQRLE